MSETPEILRKALRAIQTLEARLATAERSKREPIAIVGCGLRLPDGVTDLESLWDLLAAGTDAIGPVPADRWDAGAVYDSDPDRPGKAYVRVGGFLDAIDRFDAELFGIS